MIEIDFGRRSFVIDHRAVEAAFFLSYCGYVFGVGPSGSFGCVCLGVGCIERYCERKAETDYSWVAARCFRWLHEQSSLRNGIASAWVLRMTC